MKIIYKTFEAIFSDKMLGKIKFFRTFRGIFIKLGVIGMLLYFSLLLILLARIVALLWAFFQNI